MAMRQIPGVSIAVIKDGKVVKLQGYGFANLEHQVKVRPETIFQSGSMGKQCTAALVLKLVEDGKIKLDDPVKKYLPQVADAWSKITIRHLLTHTSGLGDPYDRLDFRKDYTDDELLEIEGKVPLLFAPGEKWSYSNMGYHVLGFLCNKVGGKFYADQLAERIFKPAGMTTARIISEADIIPNRSAGYEVNGGVLQNQSWVAPVLNTTADGSLYFSMLDLIKWDAALNSNKLFTDAQKKLMWTPVRLNNGKTEPYGFGWSLNEIAGHKHIGHGGAWQGFRTMIMRLVDDKLTVIVLANSGSANPDTIARRVAGCYIPDLAPKPLAEIPDKDPQVTASIVKMLDLKGDALRAKLSPEFLKAVPANAFDSSIHELNKSLGAFRRAALLQTQDRGEGRFYMYRLEYAKGNATIRLVLNKGGLVDGFMIEPE
ncbi:MAG: serine hydrolase [Armatimonadetes bacterium]|nr:serine hydrolase [Armatimonadota bacterium]